MVMAASNSKAVLPPSPEAIVAPGAISANAIGQRAVKFRISSVSATENGTPFVRKMSWNHTGGSLA